MGTERVLRFFMFSLVTCVTITSALPADTIYVDVSNSPGPWDGTAENPYQRIQDGINAAVNSDEVVVAPGTYYEAINFNGKGVRLYGSGGRDVTTIDGNGAYHVVQCVNSEDPNTVLDGFTITGGNAGGASAEGTGGGMYNKYSSPTVTNCAFNGNSARSGGGGIYNFGGSPTLINCSFTANSSNFSGGGMENYGGSITVSGCTFTDNTAIEFGGGMYNSGGSPIVSGCTFSGNRAGLGIGVFAWGGGMYNSGSTPTITGCDFNGNVAAARPEVGEGSLGGGIYNSNSNCNIRDCTFSANYGKDGGGMYNFGSSPSITGCSFVGNLSTRAGSCGCMVNDWRSSPTLTGCEFNENGGQVWGEGVPNVGGMSNRYGSTPVIVNCAFVANWGSFGVIENEDSSTSTLVNCTFSSNIGEFNSIMYNNAAGTTVVNCIFWGNTDLGFGQNGFYGPVTISYSDVEGGFVGTENIDADPSFVQQGHHLQEGSPCIDKGSNAAVGAEITGDLDGVRRIVDGDCDGAAVVDMGVYEFNYASMGDFDYDCGVNLTDVGVLSAAWQSAEGDVNWNRICDISIPNDRVIDLADLLLVANHWMHVIE